MQVAKGFSLVEVLVAALMMMLGVTGYISLQSQYVRAQAKLNLRGVALQLAQQKLDDLYRFTQSSDGHGVPMYAQLQSELGGQLSAGTITTMLSKDPHNTYEFDLSWQVTTVYFVDTDDDGLADQWLTESDLTLLSLENHSGTLKVVNVQVAWLDRQGNEQKVTLQGNIAGLIQDASFPILTY
jgi:Tfp pilus assembly protein PilV